MAENAGAIEYTIEANAGEAITELKKLQQQNSKVGKSFSDVDVQVDKFGNKLDEAQKSMGRFIDKQGRMREKNGQFVKGLQYTKDNLADFIQTTDSASKKSGSLNTSIGILGGGFSRVALSVSSALGPVGLFVGAVAAATAATAKMVATTAAQIKQIDVLAERANMNASAFQALAHASKTVNVDMDQLSQTIQDVNDRVGEFAGEGTGELAYAFERFLKPAGYTIEALREMGGRDVLQVLATEMERAGASGNEMTAVFEQVASNASYLLPLLKDNGEALNRLSKEANDMGLIISNENVQQAKEFDRQWKLLGGQVTNFKNIVAIGLTPAMQEFVGWVQKGVKWLDEFFGVSDAGQAKKLANEILDIDKQLANLEKNRANNAYGAMSQGPMEAERAKLESDKKVAQMLLDDIKERQNKIREEIANPARANTGPVSTYEAFTIPKSSITTASSSKQQGSPFGGFGLAGESDVMSDGAFATGFSQALLTENETIAEQLQNQRDMIKMFQEMEIGDAQTHADALIAIDKQIADEKMKTDQAMLSASGDFFGGMADLVGNFAGEQSSAYKALFAVSKGFAIANAALQMQTAIANAMALPWPTNLGAIGQAVSLGGQIASTIGSLSYGGGRATGGPVSGNAFYQMGEGNRPEVLQTGAGMFVAPGDKGRVFNGSQLEQINGGGGKNVINIYTTPGTDASVTENSDGSTDIVIQKIVEQLDNKSGPISDALTRNTNTNWRL
jgi:uncharacterized OsmC-like protein